MLLEPSQEGGEQIDIYVVVFFPEYFGVCCQVQSSVKESSELNIAALTNHVMGSLRTDGFAVMVQLFIRLAFLVRFPFAIPHSCRLILCCRDGM